MSPQFRAPVSEITTSCPISTSDNVCPSSLSVAWDAAESAVHTIRDSGSVDTNVAGSILGKRGSELISSSESTSTASSQPFLSSYGSAFLSGIFADIAEAQTDDEEPYGQDSSHRLPKKSRQSNPAFNHKKSFMSLDKIEGGASYTLASPSVISPRSHNSTIKIEIFNDQVRALQNLAFPSLPGLPTSVSSSSCTTATIGAVVTPRDGESDQDSFGWFVATDDDDASNPEDTPAPMFLPLAKPDLAFQAPSAAVAPTKENVDVEVQQALAADTIDDVLGDLF
ncbi:hypothetical protein ACHAXN_012484 [Cyclotella atomus]